MKDNRILFFLLKYGRWLRDNYIKFIAKLQNLSEDQIEEKFGRICLICYKRFRPRFDHHLLCEDCEEIFIKCWNEICSNYFKPLKQRRSETYCKECRKKGQAKDLLNELVF